MSLPKRPKADLVPSEAIAPYVKRWLQNHGEANEQKRTSGYDTPTVAFASRIGCSEDLIYRLASPKGGRWKWMSFDLADRILVGLNLVGAWYYDPELNRYYEGGVVAAADRFAARQEAREAQRAA